MVVEVVVPTRSKSTATSSPISAGGKSTISSRSGRLVKKRHIVLSDDDDAAEAGSSDFVPDDLGEASSPPSDNVVPSSDFDPSSGNTTDGMEIDGFDEDVPEKRKKTIRRKASSSSMATSEPEDVDAMDVDDLPKKSKAKGKASRKRKSVDGSDDEGKSKHPAKKARREDGDPWKLASSAVKRDWTQMKAPSLEMFHFARLVVDEYTYLDGKVLSMVTHQTAERHWVLSGTPPLRDFGALKTISAFLGIHLGIDDDGEGEVAKKRKREQTSMHFLHRCQLRTAD